MNQKSYGAVLCAITLCAACAVCAACATVDLQRRVGDSGAGVYRKTASAPVIVPIETPPVIIEKEKPVYIPENQADKARPPATGREAVEQSNRVGILKPQDYSHAAMLYDYDPDWVYEVYARPLRVSDICLQPGERVAEPPFVSDSERWLIGAGVSYEQGTAVQHVYVKPTEPAIDASLIINTDRRVYHIILRSYRETHMPIIRWRYPSTGLPNNIIPPPESATVTGEPFTGVDPRLLSFNYRIIYSLFSKPKWLPYLVYDDGAKTYITFPESVLPRELPAVFENRKDVVNYRVVENVIIIDKLVEQLTIKLERAEITVRKKRS